MNVNGAHKYFIEILLTAYEDKNTPTPTIIVQYVCMEHIIQYTYCLRSIGCLHKRGFHIILISRSLLEKPVLHVYQMSYSIYEYIMEMSNFHC